MLVAGCGASGGANTVSLTNGPVGSPIKIGVVYSSSGSQAHTGSEESNVINMVVEEVNAQGGINLENDDTQTEKSVSAAKKNLFSATKFIF